MVFHSNGRLLALPAYIKLGWKWLTGANTLAYYDSAIIKAIKCFLVQAPGIDLFSSEKFADQNSYFVQKYCHALLKFTTREYASVTKAINDFWNRFYADREISWCV
jgi:hypothetical protein